MMSDSCYHALSSEISEQWWKDYFDVPTMALYRAMLSSTLTELEVQTIDKILELPSGSTILDVCCGYGRHLIPLARKGYCVTGIDISSTVLQKTCSQAQNENLKVNVIQADMRCLPFASYFDAAILMFNSFGIFDEGDNRITLHAISRALRSGGLFLLDIPNRAYFETLYNNELRHQVFKNQEVELHIFTRLDHNTNVLSQELRWHNDFGEYSKSHAFKMYAIPEIEQLLADCGFVALRFYAGLHGARDETPNPKIVVRGTVSSH